MEVVLDKERNTVHVENGDFVLVITRPDGVVKTNEVCI